MNAVIQKKELLCIPFHAKTYLKDEFPLHAAATGDDTEVLLPGVEVVELCIPTAIFRESAQCFGDLNYADHPNLVNLFMTLLQVILYLTHCPYHQATGTSRLSFEQVVNKNGHEVAIRVRLMWQASKTMGEALLFLFATNREKRRKTTVVLKKIDMLCPLKWQQLCCQLNPDIKDILGPNQLGNVAEPSSPVYPANVMSIELSLVTGEALKCRSKQYNMFNYFVMHEDIPDQKVAIRYSAKVRKYVKIVQFNSLNPGNIEDHLLPFIELEELKENVEKTLYVQLLAAPATTDGVEANVIRRQRSVNLKRKRDDLYYQTIRSVRNKSNLMDLDSVKALMATKWAAFHKRINGREKEAEFARSDLSKAEIAAGFGEYVNHYYTERAKVQAEGFAKFKKLFTRDGDVPDAIKFIAGWWSDYLKENDQSASKLCSKTTTNLSPFQETLALFAMDLEYIFGVNTAHRDITTALVASFQVYFRTKFHCHLLYTGPPDVGKTFSLEMIHKLVIPGSSRMLAFNTPKAKSVLSSAFSCRIEIHQEMLPSTLGVLVGTSKNPSGSTNNTDSESILKTQLTEGKTGVSALAIVNGERILVEHEVDTNGITLAASNAESVPESMESRFNHVRWVSQEREDNGGMAVCDARRKDVGIQATVIKRIRKTQALMAIAGLMVDLHIIEDVNMEVANALYSKLIEYNKDVHLQGLKVTRNRERFRFLVQALATMRAINTVFDFCPPDINREADEINCNVQNSPFTFEHMKEVEKHMYAKVEDCVFAFGLLAHQYEDPIVYEVIEAIRVHLFHKLDWRDQVSWRELEEHSTHLDMLPDHSMVVVEQGGEELRPWTGNVNIFNDFVSVTCSQVSAGSKDPRADDLEALTRYLLKHMARKPQPGEVRRALKLLCEQTAKGSNNAEFPALQFKDNRITMAASLLRSNQKDKLQGVLSGILLYKGAEKGEYLYGRMNESRPFLFETVKVNPKHEEKGLEIMTGDFCDTDVSNFMSMYREEFGETQVFSDQASQILTIPLDQYGFEARLARLKYPKEVVDVTPSCDPRKFAEWTDRSLYHIQYPHDFKDCKTTAQRLSESKSQSDDLNYGKGRPAFFAEYYELDKADSGNSPVMSDVSLGASTNNNSPCDEEWDSEDEDMCKPGVAAMVQVVKDKRANRAFQ